MDRTPKTQDEFHRVMEQIDTQLRAANVQIHARALHAAGEYSKLFQLEIPMFPCPDKGAPGIYTGANAAAHIRNWFDDRYGDRQKVFMGPGSAVIVLRGDPWEIRLPRIYGRIRCVVERDLGRYANEPNLRSDGQPPITNLLTLINDFPPGLAAQLSDEECCNILDLFKRALDSMHAIENIAGNQYVHEALSDIQASVRHIFSVPLHYGQSKWSSAQAAEKLLKSFLKVKGIAVRLKSSSTKRLRLLGLMRALPNLATIFLIPLVITVVTNMNRGIGVLTVPNPSFKRGGWAKARPLI